MKPVGRSGRVVAEELRNIVLLFAGGSFSRYQQLPDICIQEFCDLVKVFNTRLYIVGTPPRHRGLRSAHMPCQILTGFVLFRKHSFDPVVNNLIHCLIKMTSRAIY